MKPRSRSKATKSASSIQADPSYPNPGIPVNPSDHPANNMPAATQNFNGATLGISNDRNDSGDTNMGASL